MHNILQWNIRGLRGNLSFLDILINEHKPMAIAVQETKLSMADSIKYTEDMNFFRGYIPYLYNDNQDSTQHGVGILVNSKYISSPVDLNINIESCQIIAVEISFDDRSITLCSLYRKSSEPFNITHLDTIASRLPKPYMILGDFNAHSPLWGDRDVERDSEGKIIEDFLEKTNDVCLFNTGAHTFLSSTHHTYSSIDLTLCSANILLDFYWEVLPDLNGSDHFPILINKVGTHDTNDNVPQYNVKKANWKLFREKCIQKFSSDLVQDPDHISIFTEGIIEIMDQTIPKSKASGQRPKPWYTEEVKDACQKAKAAHRRFFNDPTYQNYQHKKIMRAKSRRVIKTAKRKSWRKYVGNLNRHTKIKKVWDMIRKISGKYNQKPYKHLINDQGIKITNKNEILDELAEGFAKSSSAENYSDEFKKIKDENEKVELNFQSNNKEYYNKFFKLRDLKRSIKRAKNTASGPDYIHIQVIKHLPNETLRILLDVINDIWARGDFPDIWREAFIIPIPKPDKDHTNRKNYRPIALTSQLCKIMERMVNERLVHYLESSGYLSKVQCGFRKNRNCLDHLIRLETFIREAFLKNEQAMAIFFDLEKAYDTTWKYGIMKDLYNVGIRGYMAHYIGKFLDNRVFSVKIGSSFSKWQQQEEGVPQGSILSVTLFIIKINGISDEVKDPQMSSLFVDDFALMIRGSRLEIMERHLQQTLDKIQKWAIRNGFKFSIDKTVCVRFYKSNHAKWEPGKEPQFKIGPNAIKCQEQAKFLGLIFDKNLSFKSHINNLKKKCLKALNLLKVVAHQHWGADKDTILMLYRALIRSKLDYGSVVYGSARESYLKCLEPIQNQALRLALGAFHTSPITSLNALCSEPPLHIRRTKLALSYSSKLLGHPENPAYKHLFKTKYTKKSLGKDSEIKPLSCRLSKHITEGKIPFDDRIVKPKVALDFPPWEIPPIYTDLNLSFLSKKSDSPSTMLNSFYEHRDSKYRNYNEIYTDGSKMGKKVGCAVVKRNRRPVQVRLADGSSIYSAELLAIKIAIQYAFLSSYRDHVIFTDSESAVKAFQDPNFDHPYIAEAFNILHKYKESHKTIALCWIPSHVGISGNEQADKEAKKALSLTSTLKIPYTDIKPIINEYCKNLFQSCWSKTCVKDDNKLYNILDDLKQMPRPIFQCRSDETAFYRCLIGHSKLTHKYIFERDRKPQCTVCRKVLSIKHIFIECPVYNVQRQTHLQNRTDLKSIFKNVQPSGIITFLKECDIFSQL